MAWVREKNPKRKVSVPQRDPKEALEGLLSFLACKPPPGPNINRYLRETRNTSPSPAPHHHRPEIVPREPTIYSAADNDNDDRGKADEEASLLDDDDDYEPAAIQSRRRRRGEPSQHQHHSSRAAPADYHHHSQASPSIVSASRTTPQQRYVSNVLEARPHRPRTSVQARRVVSSWSNATTALVI